ncbi:probable E3 ubiquitin-protein ligase RHY1A [Mercurialis annua]|uniref:probable E3 ubiquitin-protein ligase RHY1A n=1 Tax=Mercurialis annua TaxID=3986 RepID=UPI00215FBB94|nr:probable E3 ubiquitin-protein ligase RHY1A [Mercurialis annua]
MAGMLPGVECARRRRFHQSSDAVTATASYGGSGSTRRSSFCLYTSNHDTASHNSTLQRSILKKVYEDEKLGGVARQAKERLDERLRTQRTSSSKSFGSLKGTAEGRATGGELQTEVYGLKKSNNSSNSFGSRRFSWGKLSWKSGEQDECTICLERFKSGETLVHLPCAHKFHCKCLVPWLETSVHCPCCRLEIHVDFS